MAQVGQCMMLVQSAFRNAKSFTLIPVSLDSPYVEAMFDPSSGILAVISKVMKQHNQMSPCKNVAEKLGLEGESDLLRKYPAWAAVNPWDSQDIKRKFIEYPQLVKRNRKAHGLVIKTNDPEEIMKIDQEVSLPSHAMQYSSLTENVLKNGFLYGDSYGYINAEILVKNDEFRWKPGGEGNHRVAVAAALKKKSIPVIITKIIDYDDFKFWPNVMSGLFTERAAQKVFNSIFYAECPRFQEQWINICLNCAGNNGESTN